MMIYLFSVKLYNYKVCGPIAILQAVPFFKIQDFCYRIRVHERKIKS